MESPDQHAFTHDVAVDGLENVRASGIRAEIELCVQREQLESVVMMRTRGGSAGSPVADDSALIFTLDGAVGQPRIRRHPFGKFARGAGDIENQPVQNVVGLSLDGDIGRRQRSQITIDKVSFAL